MHKLVGLRSKFLYRRDPGLNFKLYPWDVLFDLVTHLTTKDLSTNYRNTLNQIKWVNAHTVLY